MRRVSKWVGGVLTVLLVALTAIYALASAEIGSVQEGSARQYTSIYKHTAPKIRDFVIASMTDAPLRIVSMVRLDVAPDQAFETVLKDLDQWVTDVERVEWDNSGSEVPGEFGAGSIRRCFFGDEVLAENILYLDQGYFFVYNVNEAQTNIPLPPSKDRLTLMIVESDGNGGSIVTWRFYFNKEFHPISPVLETVMKQMFINDSVRALVEKFGGEIIVPNV